jgi:hypothetical protein
MEICRKCQRRSHLSSKNGETSERAISRNSNSKREAAVEIDVTTVEILKSKLAR